MVAESFVLEDNNSEDGNNREMIIDMQDEPNNRILSPEVPEELYFEENIPDNNMVVDDAHDFRLNAVIDTVPMELDAELLKLDSEVTQVEPEETTKKE